MARTLSIPARNYSPGVQSMRLDNIPTTSRGFVLALTRENWPAGKVLDLVVEISPNDGTDWYPWITASFDGGTALDRAGNVATHSKITAEWPGTRDFVTGQRRAVSQTDVRITANIVQALRTAVSISELE